MKTILYINKAISINILGSLRIAKLFTISAIGVVEDKNPKQEKQANVLKKVAIPNSNASDRITILKKPVSKITGPVPKKKIMKIQVIKEKPKGIEINLR